MISAARRKDLVVQEPDRESVAANWFAVRAEYERVGRVRTAWMVVKELFIGLFTWGLTFGEFDPKRFCDVLVVRRDTGAVVAIYRYSRLSAAELHVERLREMLESTQVFDFCRELGLGIDAVSGPGMSMGADSGEARWSAIPARLRRDL